MVFRYEGPCRRGQQRADHPHGEGLGGKHCRLARTAPSAARKGNAGVGRSGLSGSERCDSQAGATRQGFHEPALSLGRADRRDRTGEESHQVERALAGGACLCSDQRGLQVHESALPGPGQEPAPVAGDLCAGERVSGPSAAAGCARVG